MSYVPLIERMESQSKYMNIKKGKSFGVTDNGESTIEEQVDWIRRIESAENRDELTLFPIDIEFEKSVVKAMLQSFGRADDYEKYFPEG